MTNDTERRDRPVSNQLHPWVYFAIVGLALWLALAVWAFAWDSYTDYLLAIVSGFVLLAVILPLALWRMGRKHPASDDAGPQTTESFRDWAAGEFGAGQDHLKGSHAAVEALLPIAALAFGMTAFGIVLYLTSHGVI
jgi:hypothetical protein